MAQVRPHKDYAQAPLKPTSCAGGCGATVFYRTQIKVLCTPCKAAAVKAQKRAAYQRERAASLIAGLPVGKVFDCLNCGARSVATSSRQSHCEGCRIERERANRRASYHRTKDDPELRKRRAAKATARTMRLYRTDPFYNINLRMRTGITASLGTQKKGRRWEALVGYTITDLMGHLERQFLPGMGWSNRDRWHIDHVVPLASFKFEGPDDPEFRAAWALPNLRPLWSEANWKKHATRTHLI